MFSYVCAHVSTQEFIIRFVRASFVVLYTYACIYICVYIHIQSLNAHHAYQEQHTIPDIIHINKTGWHSLARAGGRPPVPLCSDKSWHTDAHYAHTGTDH